MATGTLLDTLVVKITADLTEFRIAMAEVSQRTREVARELGDAVSRHVSMGDIINASITAPLALAATQASISSRIIRQELAAISTMQRAALGNNLITGPGAASAGLNARGPHAGPGAGTVGGVVIDGTSSATRERQANAYWMDTRENRRAAEERMRRLQRDRDFAQAEYDGLVAAGVRDRQQAHAALENAQRRLDNERAEQAVRAHDAEEHRRRMGEGERDDDRPRRRGRSWWTRPLGSGGAGAAGELSEDAMEGLGRAANRTGTAMRGALGSRMANAMGLAGLGSVIASLIPLFGELAAIIGGGFAAALAAVMTPLGLVVAGITALLAVFAAANWDHVRNFIEWFNARFQEVLGERLQGIIAAAKEVLDAFAYAFKPVVDALRENGDEMELILKAFGELFIRILDMIGAAIEGFLKVFANVVKLIGAIVQGDWKTAIMSLHGIFSEAIKAVLDIFFSLFPSLEAGWNEAWPKFYNKVSTDFRNLVDGIGEQTRRAAGFVAGIFGRPGEKGAANDNGRKGLSLDDYWQDGFFGDLDGGVYKAGKGGLGGAGMKRAKAEIAAFTKTARFEFRGLGDEIAYSVGGALEDAVRYGGKLGDAMKRVGYELAALAFRKLITEPLMDALAAAFNGPAKGGKGSSGIGSTILSTALAAVFGGFRATGGPVSAGKAYIVGERGPEIMMPNTSGIVIPNGGFGGFAYNDNRVIDARGADTAAIARLERALAADRMGRRQEVAAIFADMRARGR